MTDNRRKISQPAPGLDDGKWLYLLLAPVREDIRQHPSPLAVMRIRQRVLRETAKKAATLVAA
jgi:hypothetical protein